MGQYAQFIPAALSIAGSVMGKQGADEAASGAIRAAERNAAARRFEATQLRVNAGQQIAAGQAASAEQARQARILSSRQIALAAASGASASDPTVVTMIARTAKEGSYRAAVALYQGEDAARQLRMAAASKEYDAETALIAGEEQGKAYETAGNAALFKGASSLFSKYGQGGLFGSAGDSAAINAGGADTSWIDAGTVSLGGVA